MYKYIAKYVVGEEPTEERTKRQIAEEHFPHLKIMLYPTLLRMDDKNVVDDLFEGNICYELTLVEAIKRGIVKPPKYVKCDYELRDMLVGISEQIKECDDKETRERLEEKLDKMRKIVDQAEGIPELFAKNMTKKRWKIHSILQR